MSSSKALAHFDQLYRQSTDPWQVQQRWYEQRKQALLLACLPRARYRFAFEPACGTGALTRVLAGRCDAVWATDGSLEAVVIARENTSGKAHVFIDRRALPNEWPDGQFDLVVLSEWLYYLSSEDLMATIRCCRDSLSREGTLLACHWRPDFQDRVQSTDDVHAALHTGLGWPRIFTHDEPDFLLEAWSSDGRSVAQLEGLR